MYMPQKNYADIQQEHLVNYWRQDKDIIGVSHFGDLIPEVLWLGHEYGEHISQLLDMRIKRKLRQYRGQRIDTELADRIANAKQALRQRREKEISRRLEAIRAYLLNTERDPHISVAEILGNNGHSATTN